MNADVHCRSFMFPCFSSCTNTFYSVQWTLLYSFMGDLGFEFERLFLITSMWCFANINEMDPMSRTLDPLPLTQYQNMGPNTMNLGLGLGNLKSIPNLGPVTLDSRSIFCSTFFLVSLFLGPASALDLELEQYPWALQFYLSFSGFDTLSMCSYILHAFWIVPKWWFGTT